MKRMLLTVAVCTLMLMNLLIGSSAQATPLSIPIPFFAGSHDGVTSSTAEAMELLETDILPQIESILTPEQREQFTDSLADGKSLRKAFKSMTLTPSQKTELATFLKSSLYGSQVLATLSPTDKKEFFLKKKEMFAPTPEEIGEKISEKLKFAKESSGGMAPDADTISEKIAEKLKMVKDKAIAAPTPEEIGQKIVDKKKYGQMMNPMKDKDASMFTPEEIGDRVTEKIKMAKEMAKDKAADMPSADAIGEKIGEKMKMIKSKMESAAS